ncbi:hypothetical protein GEMRC1_010220 [Eukaryota sp. GEM-RC1]
MVSIPLLFILFFQKVIYTRISEEWKCSATVKSKGYMLKKWFSLANGYRYFHEPSKTDISYVEQMTEEQKAENEFLTWNIPRCHKVFIIMGQFPFTDACDELKKELGSFFNKISISDLVYLQDSTFVNIINFIDEEYFCGSNLLSDPILGEKRRDSHIEREADLYPTVINNFIQINQNFNCSISVNADSYLSFFRQPPFACDPAQVFSIHQASPNVSAGVPAMSPKPLYDRKKCKKSGSKPLKKSR